MLTLKQNSNNNNNRFLQRFQRQQQLEEEERLNKNNLYKKSFEDLNKEFEDYDTYYLSQVKKFFQTTPKEYYILKTTLGDQSVEEITTQKDREKILEKISNQKWILGLSIHLIEVSYNKTQANTTFKLLQQIISNQKCLKILELILAYTQDQPNDIENKNFKIMLKSLRNQKQLQKLRISLSGRFISPGTFHMLSHEISLLSNLKSFGLYLARTRIQPKQFKILMSVLATKNLQEFELNIGNRVFGEAEMVYLTQAISKFKDLTILVLFLNSWQFSMKRWYRVFTLTLIQKAIKDKDKLIEFEFIYGKHFDDQMLEKLEKCLYDKGLRYYNTFGNIQKIHYKK